MLRAVLVVLTGALVACGTGDAGGQETGRRAAAAVVSALTGAGVAVGSPVWCARGSPGAPGDPSVVVLAFHDESLPGPQDPRRIADGAVVEVFATPERAAARRQQIADQVRVAGEFGYDEGGQPLALEHTVVAGPVVLRVASDVSGERFAAYRAAAQEATGGADRAAPPGWGTAECLT
ncbi:hypothetical protein [Pseudonocardia sp. DLS-67]